MLVLTRKLGEFLVLNDNIFISVFEGGNGDQVKIAIEAPEDVKIARSEMLADCQEVQRKLEAIRSNIRSDVDFVLTFEELQGMFEARGVDFASIPEGESMREGTAAGRGFAVSGGVAGAVADVIHKTDPNLEVKTARAEGLRECRKMMTLARAGKYNGYLLEGMACPGGCVAGAGTLLPVELAATVVGRYQNEADQVSPLNSPYRSAGRELD